MTRFDYCLIFVLSREGGYVDHKSDRGGRTNKGITQRVYSKYRKEAGLTDRHVKDITNDEITAIYRLKYWNQAKCGLLPDPLDLYVFDSAVNHGPARAVKLLQRALGVDDDGLLGPKTIDALHEEIAAGQLSELCRNFLVIRQEFYDAIVENDPTQQVFADGWANRLEHLRLA